MSSDDQPIGVYANLQVSKVEGGQVIGVQVGTLINRYSPYQAVAISPPFCPRLQLRKSG